MKLNILAALAASTCLSFTAHAQEIDSGDQQVTPFGSGEILVTASRLPQPATVSAIDAAAINLLDLPRVSDAVSAMPGVHRNPGNRGGSRNETGIFLRGFDQSRVPLLLDGIPVYVPYDGYVDLDRFLTGNIARIEIAKGYVPVTAGPNALGGAINIVTSRPTRELEGEVELGTSLNDNGGWGGWHARAGLGTAQEGWYAQASVDYVDVDKTALPGGFNAGIFQPEGNRIESQTEDLRISGKVALTPGDDEYAIGFAIARGEKGAPPYAGDDPTRGTFFGWPRYDKNSIYIATTSALSADTTLRLRAYYDSFRNQLLRFDDASYSSQTRPYAFTSDYDDDTVGGTVELTTSFAEGNETTFALHGKRDVHREFSPGEPQFKMEDFTLSAGIETQQPIASGTYLSLGASYEWRDAVMANDPATGGDFATEDQDALNLQAGVTHKLDAANEIHFSVARRTRFATLFERYSYRLGNGLPNPDLKPEKSTNFELGWAGKPNDNFNFAVAAFASDITNYIQPLVIGQSTSPPFGDVTQPQNLGKAWFYGLEAEAHLQLFDMAEIAANYTYLQREGRGATSDNALYGTPTHKLFIWADIAATDGLSIIPNLNLQSGRRTTDTGDGRPVDGFAMAGLKLSWDILPSTALEVSANNIFDVTAEFDEGYPLPGRTYALNLRTIF